MAKYRALRPTRGDYGPNGEPVLIQAGGTFTIPRGAERVVRKLEERGLVERVIESRRFAKMIPPTYENKAMFAPLSNKAQKPR